MKRLFSNASKRISNNFVVTMTDKAKEKMKEISKENGNKDLFFHAKGGGCNGFNYGLDIAENKFNKFEMANNHDEKVPIDDQTNLVVDGKSMLHLIGTKIDFETDIIGSRFVFENPNAKSSCGCGTSFNTDTKY